MRKLFGTDGIRGRAGDDLSPDLVTAVGRALAAFLRAQGAERPGVVIGRDTRLSGPELEAAFVEGFVSVGGDVLTTEVMPTAGIAFLTKELGTDAGVVISASHNPPNDNGIKIFGRGGWKLPLASEREIEELVHGGVETSQRGAVEPFDDGIE